MHLVILDFLECYININMLYEYKCTPQFFRFVLAEDDENHARFGLRIIL